MCSFYLNGVGYKGHETQIDANAQASFIWTEWDIKAPEDIDEKFTDIVLSERSGI